MNNLDHLEKLLAEATPGWCGAMVAAFALRRNSTMAYGEEGGADDDVEFAKRLATAMPEIRTLIAEIRQLREGLVREDAAHTVTMEQRDRAEQAADALAQAVARHLDIEVGEHSNLNDPWANALEALLSPTKGKMVVGWQPIDTAPRDGTYVLLGFDGPFNDSECPGAAVGKAVDREAGWWLSGIWVATMAHHAPVRWMPLPAAPQGKMEADRG